MPVITQYEPVQVTIQTDQVSLLFNSSNLESFDFGMSMFYIFVQKKNVGEGYSMWYQRRCHDHFREDRGMPVRSYFFYDRKTKV